MPRLNRASKKRLGGWGPGHISQLKTGYDFFGDAWGVMPNKIPLEVLSNMEDAWEEHRRRILDEWRRTDKRPWAERVFDLGEDPAACVCHDSGDGGELCVL